MQQKEKDYKLKLDIATATVNEKNEQISQQNIANKKTEIIYKNKVTELEQSKQDKENLKQKID